VPGKVISPKQRHLLCALRPALCASYPVNGF